MKTKLTAMVSLFVMASGLCSFTGLIKEKKQPDRKFGEIIGLGVKFSQGQPMEDLTMLTDLHVCWVRDHDDWARVERTPGQYIFTPAFKNRLTFYKEHNIGVVYCLLYSNPTAYPPTPENPYNAVNPEAFGRYAAASARILRESGVRFVIEIFNEPHNFVLGKLLGGDKRGQAPCPWLDHYIKMANAAVKEVKAFDPTIKLLSDEDLTIFHYRYLEAGLPHDLDGFAFHPYMRGKSSSPEIAQEGKGAAYEAPFTLTDPDHSFRSMVRRLREQGEAKMGKTPELWITEFGCPANADVTANVTFSLGKATEEELTGILVRAFIGAEASGVKVMTWFSSWDGPDGPMGLIAKDGRKRKSYFAYKTMSEQLGEYSLVRQVAGSSHLTTGVQAYLFRKGKDLKVVAWKIDGESKNLKLQGSFRGVQITDILGAPVNAMKDSKEVPQVEIGLIPVYLSGIRGEKQIESCFKAIDE
jgi:hypothetical protein